MREGHDDDWGCDPQNLLPIKDAPFFASFGTTGGNPSGGLCQHAAICTDGRYQVLTGEKQPIAACTPPATPVASATASSTPRPRLAIAAVRR
ncbi:MAG: hypothetical protein ACLTMP_00745 [Eggerthella lenta]